MKVFEKKYPRAWDITLSAIYAQLQRVDVFLETTKAEKILSCDAKHILKCEFTIAGTRESPHAS